jgi:hypothetical protein
VSDLKLRESIAQAFGNEGAALYEAEIQQLAESNYSERDLVDFMEMHAVPMVSSMRFPCHFSLPFAHACADT